MSILDSTGQYEPLDKYLPHAAASGSALSLPETLIHGAVATVADIGTTYWNSLTPAKYEASTADLLSRIDQDALQVYNENPDAIKTASFIGGLIAPVGLSMKGMNLLRAGTKGASWFSTAGQASQLAKVEEAFSLSKGAMDAATISAKWQLYRGVAYNAVADNVAAEFAIVTTLSAHPFMEDYYKDFSSNFLKSVAFGVGIQGTIGSIVLNRQIKTAFAEVQKEGNQLIKQTLWDPLQEAGISQRSHLGELAAMHIQNLDNLKAIVAKAEDATDGFSLKPYTIARVKDTILKEESRLVDRLKGAAQGSLAKDLENAPEEYKRYFLNFIADEKNAGLDKIGFAEVKGATKAVTEGETAGKLKESVTLWETITKKLKSGEEVEKTIKTDAIWTPLQGGRYISKSDAPYYLQLADNGQTLKQLEKNLDPRWGVYPLSDWSTEVAVIPTATIDKEFAQAVLWAESKVTSVEAFNKLNIDPTHLPLLKAAYLKAQELLKADPGAILAMRLGDNVAAGLKELEDAMISTQGNLIQELKVKNFGVETIALKTGTSIENIEAFLAGSQEMRQGAGLIKYASKLDVEAALSLENRALALSTDMNKIPQPEIFAKLNEMKLDATSDGILEFYLRSSPSSFVRNAADSLLSEDMRLLREQLHFHIGEVGGAELKNSLVSSTNQVLSSTGPVGSIANTIGKEVIHIKNSLKEAFETPIAGLFSQIIKEGEATMIEASTAFNVNASIKGRRIYKAGSFWIPSEQVGLGDLRQALKLSDKDFLAIMDAVDDEGKKLFEKATFNGKPYDVATPAVREMLTEIQNYGREMYDFKNAYMKAIGKAELGDIGFWTPSFNPRNKSVAYVHDMVNNQTSMLYADSDELLASYLKEYDGAMLKKHGPGWEANYKIITKDQQEAYNNIAGRHDSLYMQAADLSKQHGGSSASTIVSTDTSVFKDILQGYQHHVNDGVEKIVELQMNTTMNHLKNLSDMSQMLYSPATKGVLQKLSSKPVDVGQTLRNILLGRPLISEHKAWGELQQRGQVYTDLALKTVTEIFEPILAPSRVRTSDEWTKVVADMQRKGIVNPFADLDKAFGETRYLMEGKGGNQELTPRMVALGNGLAATLLLRVGELAQPFVNAVSLPILTSGAVNRRLAGSFMGAAIDPKAKFALVETMYDGWRLGGHPTLGAKWSKIGEAKGLFDIELRNVTELLEHSRSLDPGVLTTVEKGMESSLVRMLSKPADFSEKFVRKQSFFTGVAMAKKAYPGLSDVGVYTFARNFMDEAVGNYTAAQRPAMFQGTFGVAMGLFQTYMLTLAQNMYRQVEYRDWAALGKMLLTQSTIFGASSLPGFHIVSEQIGKNFSDQNVDLQTGLLRAVDDPLASMILYGLPSSFGPGVVTRGDIQPRIPNPIQGISSLALANIAAQSYQATERIASAAWNADESAGKAMLEAISLQSVSRPLARVSELVSGRSITSRGDVVQQGAELYTVQGVISRLMATRPLEEIKAREALHLNTIYGQADSDKRKAVTSRLKSHIRSGDMDGDKLDVLASEYLRTGSSQGWRAAVADAVKQAGQSGDATTLGKLKPNTPLYLMIDDME